MTAHSIIGPSALHRVLKCSASALHKGESQDTEATIRGTVLHEVTESCLRYGTGPEGYVGAEMLGYTITREDVDQVQICLDAVHAKIVELDAAPEDVFFELRLESKSYPEFFGTIDCVILKRESGQVVSVAVVDFKFGQRFVSAENNDQGLGYLVLAFQEFLPVYRAAYSFTIVQPGVDCEGGPVRTWNVTSQRMGEFSQQLEDLVFRIRNDATEFRTGDHCRFCPRNPGCPALEAEVRQMFEVASQDGELTPESAGELLQMETAVSSYLKRLKKYVHGELEKGTPVPGFALKKSYGNRNWIHDPDTIKKKLQARKFKVAQIQKTGILSPAQMEKSLAGVMDGKDAKTKAAEIVNALCDRELKGTTVVPEGTAGSFIPHDARDDFKEVNDE